MGDENPDGNELPPMKPEQISRLHTTIAEKVNSDLPVPGKKSDPIDRLLGDMMDDTFPSNRKDN